MGSPCAVIIGGEDRELAARVARAVSEEARRIEAKFTRYRPSVVTSINESAGSPVELDAETADLIDYAHRCHMLSDGLFDITSGALRRAWRFDGTGRLPSAAEIADALRFVGWHRVQWERPMLTLEPGMEIDFGGIGKEYAVDCAMQQAIAQGATGGVLVNFGGDLRVSGARADGSDWRVAIEDVDSAGRPAAMLALSRGALATSGDAHRFLIHEGKRYGHVLDPRTGWPIEAAPRSVTVLADSCSEAGLLAKLALLRGKDAEAFLREEQVRAWVTR
jgi:thiamine biosynthesis lipoprotein